MADAARFPYAAARMQHRHGLRPTDTTWHHWHRIEHFGHLIETVRASALGPWIADFTVNVDVHRIERGLRAHYRREVDEVSAWLPRAWSGAAAWMRWLPDLPAIARLRRGQPLPDWLGPESEARILGGQARGAAAGPGELLEARPEGRGDLFALWLKSWEERWPAPRASQRAALGQVRPLVARLAGADDDKSLEAGLRRVFRRHTREPAGAFAWLALLHLDFTRLRGLLLRRRIGLPVSSRGHT